MRRYLKLGGFALSMLIAFLCIVFKLSGEYGWINLNLINQFEMKILDQKFVARGKVEPKNDVVIMAADEESIAQFGQWPWERKIIATLVQKLTEAGVKAVGFDMFFTENDAIDVECGRVLDKLSKIKGFEDQKEGLLSEIIDPKYGCKGNDGRLGEALQQALKAGSSPVLGYFFFTNEEEVKRLTKAEYLGGEKTIYPARIQVVMADQSSLPPIITEVGVQVNVPDISAGTPLMGFVNQAPDADGMYRSSPMFVRFNDNYYPSLALQLVKTYLGGNLVLSLGTRKLLEEEGKTAKLSISGREVPIDDRGRFIINYYGPAQTFRHISAFEVHSGKVGAADLKGRIVIFGATTVGIFDIRPTPFESIYPGVEIHANIIENILHNDFLTRPNLLYALEILAMLFFGALFGVILSRLKLQYAVILVLLITGLCILFDFEVLFKVYGYYSKLIPMYIQIVLTVIGVTILRYFAEEREKGKIRKVFQTYLTKSVVEEVLKDTSKLQLGGVKKNLTVFFSDIRGFTTISEKLSPEQLVSLLNDYLSPMTSIIFKYDGTLDKYMGDAIMAIFGAPLDQTDHAERCCNAALDMLRELNGLHAKWRAQGLPEIRIGIGINTGEMVVGNMGSDVKFEYTVIGDNVNLGSRLEGTNKEYGTTIIVSEFTHGLVADRMVMRELDLIRVKGKKEPVRIFELRGRGQPDPAEAEIIERFSEGLQLYRMQKWGEATAAFKGILERHPNDGPSKRYLERIQTLCIESPGECWDGVWVMKSK